MPSWRQVSLPDLGPELGIDLQVPWVDVMDTRFAGGAKGDGVFDDALAIQQAINAASNAGGGRVVCKRNAVHGLKQAGTKTVSRESGGTNSQGFCLSIPANVVLDLNGATLKKIDSTDSALVMNATPDTSFTDHDLGVMNGTLDGNTVQLNQTRLFVFTATTRPVVTNVRIINATQAGLFFWNNDGGYYDNLSADSCAGNAFTFGSQLSGKEERGAFIGSLSATNITADAISPATYPGNPLFGVLQDCSVGSVYGKSCAGGVKLTGYSGFDAGSTAISRIRVVNGTTSNSGLKFQANAVGYTVETVVCTGNQGEGIFTDNTSQDNTVGTYYGKGNGLTGSNPDVLIDGTRLMIGVARSRNAGREAFQVKATAVQGRVALAKAINPGQVSGSGSVNSTGVLGSGGQCVFGDLTVLDDQGTATMNRGLNLTSGSDIIHVGNYRFSTTGPNTPWNGFTSSDVLILNPRIGSNVLHGEVSPAGAATTTAVSNNNCLVSGSTVQPIVEVVYLNAAAQTLGIIRATFTNGTITFKHAAAAGTEKYGYRIVGYRLSTTAAS